MKELFSDWGDRAIPRGSWVRASVLPVSRPRRGNPRLWGMGGKHSRIPHPQGLKLVAPLMLEEALLSWTELGPGCPFGRSNWCCHGGDWWLQRLLVLLAEEALGENFFPFPFCHVARSSVSGSKAVWDRRPTGPMGLPRESQNSLPSLAAWNSEPGCLWLPWPISE